MKILAPGLELGMLLASLSTHGQNWVLTSAPVQSWTAIACSSDGTNLVAASSSIYTSTNFGLTWTATTAPSSAWSWVGSSPDGTKLWAANSEGIYVSTNSGAVWTGNHIPLGPFGWFRWAFASSADGKMLVTGAGDYYVYTSNDDGVNWTTTTPSNFCQYSSVACSADGTKLLAFAASITGCRYQNNVYISTNSAGSWVGLTTQYAPLSDAVGTWCPLTVSADGTQYVAAGPLAGIYVSANSGFDWQMTSAPADKWTSIASSADGRKLVATALRDTSLGLPGDIWTSSDAGATWVQANAPMNNWMAVASSADGNRLAAAVAGGGIYVWGTAPTPVLNIHLADGFVTLSWTAASNLVLEQNSDLEAANWVPNLTTPTLTNGQFEIVMPLSTGSSFFRLKN